MEDNTKEGIAAELGNYASFYAVMSSRYDRVQQSWRHHDAQPSIGSLQLTPFIILGRYHTDLFGQVRRLNREMFTDEDRTAMPPVMTVREFESYCNAHVLPRSESQEDLTIIDRRDIRLPPPHIVCTECGKTWELATCHDLEYEMDFVDTDLTPYIGKILSEVVDELRKRTDALLRFSDTGEKFSIQNSQWVQPQGETLVEEEGWREVTKDYVIQSGDHANLLRTRYFHGPCWRERDEGLYVDSGDMLKETLTELLTNAGFEDVQMEETPVPERLVRGMSEVAEMILTQEEADKTFRYIRVQTRQGSFGVIESDAPAASLDLGDSGVSVVDLDPEFAQLPPNFPPLIGMSGLEQLAKLRKLLMARAKES